MKTTKFSLGLCIALSLAACSSNKSAEDSTTGKDLEAVLTDSTVATPKTPSDLPGTQSKLVRTANIDFQVKNVYQSTSRIYSNVKKMGGLVMHNDINTREIDSKTIPLSNDSMQVISSHMVEAKMTVKVPSENLNDFVQSVASDATVIYTANLDIEDRSIDYLGSKLKQESRGKILAKQLRKDTLKTNDILEIANQQEGIIDQKMNNLRTDAHVRFSIIELSFRQNLFLRKEIVPNDNLGAYEASALKRAGDAMAASLNLFLNIIIGLLYIWPLFLVGMSGWIGYRYIKRKTKAGI